MARVSTPFLVHVRGTTFRTLSPLSGRGGHPDRPAVVVDRQLNQEGEETKDKSIDSHTRINLTTRVRDWYDFLAENV